MYPLQALLSLSLALQAPENLAPRATVAASSEFGDGYRAKNLVDGRIPAAGSRDDAGGAWCARGGSHPGGVTLTFTWKDPVTVGELVYYGRTAWEWTENWKDCEIRIDGAETPALRAVLTPGHGPQRLTLPKPVPAKVLTLRLLTSHGGSNPGASEIQIFPAPPPADALPRFQARPEGAAAASTVPASPDLARRLKAGELRFTKLLLVQRHPVDSSHVYTYHCEGQRNGGGLYLLDVTDGSLRELLPSPGGQILGVDLSYDGSQILFSWRKDKLYQLYRINIDGGGLTQLTDGDAYNYDGCWLPDGGIAFLSTRVPRFAYCWTSPVGTLHRMNADGSGVRALSANYLNDFTPAVMNDGSIIYGRWEYVDRPAIPIQSLWTLNPDGTMLRGYFGNRVLDPATFIEPQAIPGTSKVLCTLTGHNGACRGAIGIIDPAHGANADASIRNLTPDVPLRRVDVNTNGPRGPYQTPYPVDAEHYLVSRDGSILLRDYEGTREATVIAGRGMGFYNPRPVRPRPRPPLRPPAVAEEAPPWATVFVQDVHLGLEPQVAPGEVKRIAVVQEVEKSAFADVKHRAFGFQFPVVSCGATYAPKKVWGYATVEADGSAHFRVPSGLPLYFMALDAEGRAVQRMRSFTHLMPGERQGCVGCHADRNRPAPAPGRRPSAMDRAAEPLTEPEWGVAGFSYPHVVQPVLDAHCVSCHGGLLPQGGVDLSGDFTDFFNVSYETLARAGFDERWGGRKYTASISTFNGAEKNILQVTPKAWGSPASKLADLVARGHPGPDGRARLKMTPAERFRIYSWIDLNVPYYGTSTSRRTDLEGCRRLYPPTLDAVLKEVGQRRCASCHPRGIPRTFYTRITGVEANAFLAAPLAAAEGGSGKCGAAVFKGRDDPDYRAIRSLFEPLERLIREAPREDMDRR